MLHGFNIWKLVIFVNISFYVAYSIASGLITHSSIPETYI